MRLKLISLVMMLSALIYGDDNEIYVSQSGATANIDLVQLGSGNMIGGLDSTSGNLTPFDLDGGSLNLILKQIGDGNSFLGDIYGDNITATFEFDGDNNAFTIQADPDNTYGISGSNYDVSVVGNSNTFSLETGTTALSDNLDMDWTVNGDGNNFDFSVNYDGGTNFVDVDGNDNTINFEGTGYANGYFYLDQTGNDRTFEIFQSSTLASDWLTILSTGSDGVICIQQDDSGLSVSC